jgi:hypothetical protein
MAVRLSALRTGRPSPPPGIFLVHISVRDWVYPRAIVPLEELGQSTKSTSSGLEPTTFRLIAQCLNQLRYRVPPLVTWSDVKITLIWDVTPYSSIDRYHRRNMLLPSSLVCRKVDALRPPNPLVSIYQTTLAHVESTEIFKITPWETYVLRKQICSNVVHESTPGSVQVCTSFHSLCLFNSICLIS